MMKFPYELSEDRQSLLSPEDQVRYEYEHSPYFSAEIREQAEAEFRNARMYAGMHYMQMINEDEEFKDLEPSEKQEMTDELMRLEAKARIDQAFEMLIDEGDLTDEQIQDVKEYALEIMMSDRWKEANNLDEENSLDEALGDAPGHDMTYWMKDLPGWGKFIFGLCGTGLSLALGGLASAVMAGHHAMAMHQFRKMMNRTVEKVDMGLNKKKSFFMKFVPKMFKKSREDGDQSQACFRSIQEIVERDMAKNCLIAGVSVGLLSGDGMTDAINGNSSNGGLMGSSRSFKANVIDKLAGLVQIGK